MDIELFNFELPPDRIADAPPGRRDGAKLFLLDRSTGEEKNMRFREIVKFLKAGDALVINNTKVLKARLFARRKTGGK
ncbi:MAG: S-adenosylmethionine:tRNA ribosyltransferase-isomerase, partial [candidate division Zixibacteria bacterium]|nr:S-adenosylmethionine:tRNA ribosyltransferase-isomerase [candidate division Zixibacteria bacterium]